MLQNAFPFFFLKKRVRTQVRRLLRVKKIVQSISVYRIVVDEILSRKVNNFFPGHGEAVLNRTVRLTHV